MSRRLSNNPFSFLYNHNPFYLLSTLAILYALHVWQSTGGISESSPPTTLALVLIGFVGLLMVVGIGVVKFGGIWEDARSIFLSILLIAFAISVSLDMMWLSNPAAALVYSGGALLAIVLVTEIILGCLRIRFPGRYRVSYYLLLGLIFMYPVVFTSWFGGVSRMDSSWLVLGFTSACAVGFMTLLPAIKYGKTYVADNGTPWSWPLYPWSIFAILFLAVVLRSYTLCLSFIPEQGVSSGYCLFFLTPLAFALVILWLHAAIVNKDETSKSAALFYAVPLVLATTLPLDFGPVSQQFTSLFTGTLASPLFLAISGLSVIYLVVWFNDIIRKPSLPEGRVYFLVSLFVSGFVPVDAIQFSQCQLTNWWPLMLICVLQLDRARRQKRTDVAAWALVPGALSIQVMLQTMIEPGVLIWLTVAGYLSLVLVCAIINSDRWAHILRLGYAIAIPLSLTCFVIAGLFNLVDMNGAVQGSFALTMLCLLVYELTKTRVYLPAAMTCLAMTLACGGTSLIGQMEGLPTHSRIGLIVSAGFLLTGLAISVAKAGWLITLSKSIGKTFEESLEKIRSAANHASD